MQINYRQTDEEIAREWAGDFPAKKAPLVLPKLRTKGNNVAFAVVVAVAFVVAVIVGVSI